MNYFLELKTTLFDRFNENHQVKHLTKGLSQAAGKVLEKAWLESGLSEFTGIHQPCLVAVGGFGRDELFPYSDVDILVLLNHHELDPQHEQFKNPLEKFITLCWDLGLEIGSSVRNIDECLEEAKKDVTVRTSLLEARFLCGNKKLFQSFQQRFDADLDPKAFFTEKVLELRQRHQKFQNTPYSLEPNVKESPGGLRDIQVILWITRAAKLGNTFKDLNMRGIITGREANELTRNHHLLQVMRANLHLLSKRRQDQLIFEIQTPLAQLFGLENTPEKRASEQIMRRYYWAAKAVTQLNEVLIQNIEALLFPQETQTFRPLTENFIERQGQLDLIDPLLYNKKPDQILATFVTLATHSGLTGLSSTVLRALYNARELMDAKWRNDPVNRAQFMEILKADKGVFRSINAMNQTSVLGRYLPPFRKIVGQMQHDLFHVYTVDQHILTVLKNIRRFFVPELSHEFPYCSELAANFDKPWLLVIAALFHDIAKGRGGDHSDLGKKDVRLFAKQHGMTAQETEVVTFLVAQHLSMSQIAQKSDISNPEIIELFAKQVVDEYHLTALYLLTVADIRGTSPKVWNAWKAKLLEELYRSTLSYFGGAKHDANSQLELRQQDAIDQLRLHGIPEGAHDELWKHIHIGFFLKHDSNDIAWITRHLYQRVNSDKPIVQARLSPIGEGLQIAVYVADQPDLFARICSYFDKNGFTIQDAIIHTTNHGYALDTFQVGYSGEVDDIEYRPIIQMVEHDLANILQTKSPLPEPQKGRVSRQSRSFPMQPRVKLIPDEKGEMFILSLTATDRVGLLYSVSTILAKHQISLKTAKINTLGERVEDTLLVDGDRLKLNPKLQIQLETELIEALAN
jgi:[protein-PII] uridylyltransferase